jgi:hypothetical protein
MDATAWTNETSAWVSNSVGENRNPNLDLLQHYTPNWVARSSTRCLDTRRARFRVASLTKCRHNHSRLTLSHPRTGRPYSRRTRAHRCAEVRKFPRWQASLLEGSTTLVAQEIEGRLDGVEVNRKDGPVQIDEEGSGAAAASSKKRFIAPAITMVLAMNGAEGPERERIHDGDLGALRTSWMPITSICFRKSHRIFDRGLARDISVRCRKERRR